jgi:hypothetical protein
MHKNIILSYQEKINEENEKQAMKINTQKLA